jgi:hypothetical protein
MAQALLLFRRKLLPALIILSDGASLFGRETAPGIELFL